MINDATHTKKIPHFQVELDLLDLPAFLANV